jgi:flagellar biosynthesis protein FlhG
MTVESTAKPKATVIAVTSGKGGVGKTNVVINVAVALARLGYKIGILDADFGLGNVDVLLGLTPERHVGHLLNGDHTLQEITLEGPRGVQVVPASSGLQSLTALTPAQHATLNGALDEMRASLDFLLIDTGSGVSDNVLSMLLIAERVMLVTSLEPAAVVDAYATAKVLTGACKDKDIGIVVNGVRDGEEAALAFRQIDIAAERFLGRNLRYYGFVTGDPAVRESVLVQRAVVDHLPQSPASRCFRILASRLAGLGPAKGNGPRLAQPASANATVSEVQQCA